MSKEQAAALGLLPVSEDVGFRNDLVSHASLGWKAPTVDLRGDTSSIATGREVSVSGSFISLFVMALRLRLWF